ncbi:hypothetical protein D3C76_1447680 [compost metagenome]
MGLDGAEQVFQDGVVDAGLVRVVRRVIQGADKGANDVAAAHVDVHDVQARGVLLKRGDTGKACARGPCQQNSVDRIVADYQGALP